MTKINAGLDGGFLSRCPILPDALGSFPFPVLADLVIKPQFLGAEHFLGKAGFPVFF